MSRAMPTGNRSTPLQPSTTGYLAGLRAAVGENSEEVLRAAGYDESESQALRAGGVIGQFPDGDRSVP